MGIEIGIVKKLRVEAGEPCSAESKLSLASTFDITLSSLLNEKTIVEVENKLEPSRILTLIAIVGVVIFLMNTFFASITIISRQSIGII